MGWNVRFDRKEVSCCDSGFFLIDKQQMVAIRQNYAVQRERDLSPAWKVL